MRGRRLSGVKIRRQVPIGRYIADFACHEARLVIEADGGQHDVDDPAEIARTAAIEAEGYRVLRFSNTEILSNTEGVAETILAELRAARTRSA